MNFKMDVEAGLNATPKTLPSKYFYDTAGDALFVEIMKMPEYYLTDAEMEIFTDQTAAIIKALDLQEDSFFELIELGAGDGFKTKKLLNKLTEASYAFSYIPVDISQNALTKLCTALVSEIPTLKVQPQQGDYFEILKTLKNTHHKKVVLFLGSSIGNMLDDVAADFIYKLGANLKAGDKLLLGVDLIKAQEIVLPAYNDATGITSAFNLNLLTRINNELQGNFDVSQFRHKPAYTEEEGIAKSYLESTTSQDVYIEALGITFHFNRGETIHTEISRKYNDSIISKIIEHTDFTVSAVLHDSKNYFGDYCLHRNG